MSNARTAVALASITLPVPSTTRMGDVFESNRSRYTALAWAEARSDRWTARRVRRSAPTTQPVASPTAIRTVSWSTSATATEGRCCPIACVSKGMERTRVHPQLTSAPWSPKASAPRAVSGRKISIVEYSTAGAVALRPRCTTTATLTRDTARMTSWSSQNHELVHGPETERTAGFLRRLGEFGAGPGVMSTRWGGSARSEGGAVVGERRPFMPVIQSAWRDRFGRPSPWGTVRG